MANILQKYILYCIENKLEIKEDFLSLYELSKNPNITWKFVLEHPEIPWNYSAMTENPNITWEIIRDNYNIRTPLFGPGMVENPNITLDIIQQNPHIQWEMSYINANPNITFDMLKSADLLKYNTFSRNINITNDIVKNNKHKVGNWGNWNFEKLGRNPSITIDIIKLDLYQHQINNFIENYSLNPNLTINDIINNPELNWHYSYIVENPAFTYDMLLELDSKLPDKQILKLPEILKNPNLTLDMFKSESPINIKFIINNYYIINNPNLSYSFIHSNFGFARRHESQLFKNKLTYDKYTYNRLINNYIAKSLFIIQSLNSIIREYV